MVRRRTGDAGRASGAASAAVVASVLTACVLALAGCAPPAPEPAPDCGDRPDLGDPVQQRLQDRLDEYGLWSQTWDDPPTADDLKRPAPVPFGFDPDRKVYLTSILLAPGVSGRVSIVKPRDAQLFVASSWDRMGSLTATDLRLLATRSVDLVGCDGIASYPGLTIVDGPECVVFGVEREGDDRIAQVSVPFFGAEC
jgi:hypothetical protein